jgi:hypothetical protein
LDPAANQILIDGMPVPTLSEGEEAHAWEQQHTILHDEGHSRLPGWWSGAVSKDAAANS